MSPSTAEIKGKIKAATGVRLSCYELNLSMLTTRPLSYDLCIGHPILRLLNVD